MAGGPAGRPADRLVSSEAEQAFAGETFERPAGRLDRRTDRLAAVFYKWPHETRPSWASENVVDNGKHQSSPSHPLAPALQKVEPIYKKAAPEPSSAQLSKLAVGPREAKAEELVNMCKSGGQIIRAPNYKARLRRPKWFQVVARPWRRQGAQWVRLHWDSA